MLLPVGARSAASPTVSVAKPVLSGEQTAAPPSPNPTVNSASSDVAGSKLNLAMLSGQGRMGENIASVADVVGEFLGMARGDLEPTDAYLARLSTAINALPEADRLKLQAFVAKTYAKLQLNALMAALANPTGKDAITVAIAFEISRETSGDRQTQSVISSYRQAAGDNLAPIREQGAYRPPAAQAPTGSSNPPVAGSSSPAQPPGTAESAPQSPIPDDRPRGTGAEKTATTSASIPDGNIKPPASAAKAFAQPTMLVAEPETQSAPQGGAEQTETEGGNNPPSIRDDASSRARKDAPGALAAVRQPTRETPVLHQAQNGQGAGPETERPVTFKAKIVEALAEQVAKGSVIPVNASTAALAPLLSDPGLNEADLISSLLKLAQQADAPIAEGAAMSPRQTDKAMTPGPQYGTPQEQPATEADATPAGLARAPSLDASGRDTNPSPPLPTLTGDAAATIPIAREAVPFAILHYLVHDEPEEQESGRQDKEGHEDFEEDAEGEGNPSDENADEDAEGAAAVEETAAKDDMMAPDEAARGESAVTDKEPEPTEKYPKPRAQRLQEAEQLGPSHRELSAADPMHQMYLRMSGGI